MNRFTKLLKNQQAFIPFFMLGDPTPEASLEIIKAAIDGGCQALELGLPFADPIADGPVIQASAERALKNGTDFAKCLELITAIREYSDIPIGLLIYFNLIYRQGVELAYQKLAAAGVDAILQVDVPLEEAEQYNELLTKSGLASINLIAPNTSEERAKKILNNTTAFAYVVSDYGTTGVRSELPQQTFTRIQNLKAMTDVPLVIGFGINTAEQVQDLLSAGADGVIIGSAITKIIAKHVDDVGQAKVAVTSFINNIMTKIG